MSAWGWQPQRPQGIWRHGAGWLRPFFAAIPYLTVGLLMMMMYFISGTLVTETGVAIDLPEGDAADGANVELVALVIPVKHETLVFFDDTRYLLGDAASMVNFQEQLAARAGHGDGKPMLVLADRRVAGGELMKLAEIARRSGIAKLLIAEKKAESAE